MFAAGAGGRRESASTLSSPIHPSNGSSVLPEDDSAAPFALRLEPMDHGWVRVRVEGELALTSASILEVAVERELRAQSHVLLDFSRIEFIDSTGLRAMTALVRTAKTNGRKLRLSSDMPAHARRLMEIVGLLPFVPIETEDPPARGERPEPS
jgi:anti-anti-sigma factor